MNFSAGSSNLTAVVRRDTFETALTKNIIVVALCISINYINGTLVHTFSKHQVFNINPRYILFIHLVVNDMLQLSLACLLHVIYHTFFTINLSLCCFLLFITLSTTFNTPVNLASMAIERYIAVCIPLRHAQICTVRRTYILIGLIWVLSSFLLLPDIFILFATGPLSSFSSRVICSRSYVFRSPSMIKKKSISHYVFLCLVWITLLYTYFRILFAARAASADARKARNTILLHGLQLLMCMMTYVRPLLETLLLYMFPAHLVQWVRFTSYVFIQILPRFISPVVYGLRDQTFRRYLRRYLLCGQGVGVPPPLLRTAHLPSCG